MNPWDPNWRPDPTGQRLAVIQAARRGAVLSAAIFGALVVVAAVIAPPVATSAPGADLLNGILIALLSLPALALLGAALTAAALASRAWAVSAGVAIGVGVPVAAVASALIGVLVFVAFSDGAGHGVDAAGRILRGGVTAAVRISPLIAAGSALWVVLVRRVGRVA